MLFTKILFRRPNSLILTSPCNVPPQNWLHMGGHSWSRSQFPSQFLGGCHLRPSTPFYDDILRVASLGPSALGPRGHGPPGPMGPKGPWAMGPPGPWGQGPQGPWAPRARGAQRRRLQPNWLRHVYCHHFSAQKTSPESRNMTPRHL